MNRAFDILKSLLIVGVLAVVIGCSNPADKLTGTWEGVAVIQRPPTGNASLDKQLANLKTEVNYSLVLKKDKSYTETVGKNLIQGTWAFDRGTLTLSPKTFNGKDPAIERERSEKMMAGLNIHLPLPEGTDGPRQAMVSDDFAKITMPSVGTAAELKKIGK
jgi:hypothetical protein